MPTPGTQTAPTFAGRRVSDFLDSLDKCADQAGVAHTVLPTYVLRYCRRSVRRVIEHSTLWVGTDWLAVRLHLLELYGSNDRTPIQSGDRLRAWTAKHAQQSSILTLQQVDKYYRAFTRMAGTLVTDGNLLQKDANLCFYRGIPESLRKRIRKRFPAANQIKTQYPRLLYNWLASSGIQRRRPRRSNRRCGRGRGNRLGRLGLGRRYRTSQDPKEEGFLQDSHEKTVPATPIVDQTSTSSPNSSMNYEFLRRNCFDSIVLALLKPVPTSTA
ncbi:hypothetical protein Hypma_003100 [Hypsizygus marmoreus]|uniref:Uncharacterized protein n=1 Tax=Hypsizygus marmoreus TaxID=39966 RepID=A0A369JBG0_HYPMA|nr:hypothetical protein Hypma_003100 [Hypsizygus marmoreus]